MINDKSLAPLQVSNQLIEKSKSGPKALPQQHPPSSKLEKDYRSLSTSAPEDESKGILGNRRIKPQISGVATDKIIRNLRFYNFSKINARGFSGSIWLLWNSSFGQVQVLDKFGQGIMILIDNGDLPGNARRINLFRAALDYRNLIDMDAVGSMGNRETRPFRFEMAWLAHDSFVDILKTNWSDGMNIHEALSRCQEVLQH
ncbi:hypothetical protein REPUB_Repub05bG0141200 [Reevesia pubescens]